MDTAVIWFRDDLRVDDNPTLVDALGDADVVVPLYVFDPRHRGETRYGTEKIGGHRARFRRESVTDLRASLRARGGDLVVRSGRADEVVPAIVHDVGADAMYAQTTPGTEERDAEAKVREALPEHTAFHTRVTHTLYHPDDLPTPPSQIEDTYTPWRKDVEGSDAAVRDPLDPPERVPTPDLDPGTVPTLSELGIDPPPEDDRAVLPFEGGESAGTRRLDAYLWERDCLREYKETRNGLLGADYSSKFSPWLAAGCLSPRRIHAEVDRYERERVANEDTYWLVFELLWRDFFQFQFHKHGAAFFEPTGIRNVEQSWRHDRAAFERWAAGETGVPFVDANMRELDRTGYMSNRGRQNVASFLADALEIDWRWGAAHFEAQLVDYDVASNWGNWAYQAGVGNDSRDGFFDVLSQAEYYDEDAAYVQTWLPELEALPPEYAHRPWRLSEDEQATYGVELGVDYPRPMLDVEARYEELGDG
ncbi:deoxyribodipyrimidine photo-lyase (single-stranded DNA-specific) [Natronoarchaeum philippinense]|uniref:Cryptochrome DASH n=1 Tax=Natronoarchaeum philippinense TaxID=558529 RepID=A0A285P1C3_NATPI|nr:DASH family cryptochrome [Natronoarchaeum philippinense]SNZ15258.1 deoxyribodipyrimidine photo-lyase (single-stranded DNA-specific) [Natronoarchaeum philippinense]